MRKLSIVLSVLLIPASGMFASAYAAKPTNLPNTSVSPTVTEGKLTGGHLQACLAHESAIKNRSENMVNMGQNMETKFNNIALRVEQYYTDKVLPNGKTVSNYSQLLADIQTKKTAVDADLTLVQSDATNFSCSSTDPKTQLTGFRTDMQTLIQGLKDYRTSIKNLIVAISTLSGTETTVTPTMTPSVTPTVTTSPTVSTTTTN